MIYDAAMAACDGLDGVVDGLISNQTACNATFDPNVVRCAGGVDTGNTCLSDAQIAALNVMNNGAKFDFFMPSGLWSTPGFNVWGADLGRTQADAGGYALQAFTIFLTLGTVQPTWPVPSFTTPYLSPFLDQFVNYGVVRNPAGTYQLSLVRPRKPWCLCQSHSRSRHSA